MRFRSRYAQLSERAQAFEARQKHATLDELASARAKGWGGPPPRLSKRSRRRQVIGVKLGELLGLGAFVAGLVIQRGYATGISIIGSLAMIGGGYLLLSSIAKGIKLYAADSETDSETPKEP